MNANDSFLFPGNLYVWIYLFIYYFCPVWLEVTPISSLSFHCCRLILPQKSSLKGRVSWRRNEGQWVWGRSMDLSEMLHWLIALCNNFTESNYFLYIVHIVDKEGFQVARCWHFSISGRTDYLSHYRSVTKECQRYKWEHHHYWMLEFSQETWINSAIPGRKLISNYSEKSDLRLLQNTSSCLLLFSIIDQACEHCIDLWVWYQLRKKNISEMKCQWIL